MKQKAVYALLALLVVGLVAGSVSAFGMLVRQEGRQEILEALEANDFQAWKQAMQSELTQERFEQMQQRHTMQNQMMEQKEAMETALENGDYEEWKSIVSSMEPTPRVAEKILTQEDFNMLVQLHQARESGDFETMQELRDEFGLEPMGCMGRHFGNWE